MSLEASQIERYSRQLLLGEIGGYGQEKLLAASVFLLGAGGLGSPVALYLVAAGVGRLVIADSDTVDLSNLQRQILFATPDIGKDKATTAARTLKRLNPDVTVQAINQRVTQEILDEVLPVCQVVVDASDNFATRYLLNKACLKHHKPLVTGAVLGFSGQITTLHHGIRENAPCYQCLFPTTPNETNASCTTSGVLGGVAGVVGSLSAIEVVKELLGIGTPLVGELLLIDTLHGLFHRVKFPKNPTCLTCRPS